MNVKSMEISISQTRQLQ